MHQTNATQVLQQGQQAHQRQRNHAQALAQAIELDLQGRGNFFGVRQLQRQTAHLGLQAGCRDHQLGTTAGEQRVHIGHVAALAQHGDRFQQRGLLAHRLRLTGQSGLVDLQPHGKAKAPIGADAVTGFEQQDIARDQFVCANQAREAIAAHPRLQGQHRLQGIEAAFGPVFLVEAHQRIDHHHRHNHHSVLGAAGQRRQYRSPQQGQDQDALELPQQHKPGRALRRS